jgi:FMN-dependent NADH-azoreductase
MKLIMGFIGLDDVEMISAGGLNMGNKIRNKSLVAARTKIHAIGA